MATPTKTRITEIPAQQYAPLFGEDGLRHQWYSKVTSSDRADREQVQIAFAQAYVELLDLPVPRFAWRESPAYPIAEVETKSVNLQSTFDGIADICLKQFHSVLATYFVELCKKDDSKRHGDRLTAVREVYDRVFDEAPKSIISAIADPTFIKTKALLQVFVNDNPERFPDLKMSPERRAKLLAVLDAISDVYAFQASHDSVIFYERPTAIHREDTPRGMQLHNEAGPAVAFSDGEGRYMLDGIVVPKHVVMDPQSITLDEIEKHDNIEVRRLMIQQRGVGWYLAETKAEVVHMDMVKVFAQTATVDPDDRELAMPRALIRDKNKRLYLCGTDGSTDRVYYMMCPGNVRTCAEAHQQLSGGLDESKCVAQS